MKTKKICIEVEVPETTAEVFSDDDIAHALFNGFRFGDDDRVKYRIIDQPTHTAEGEEWLTFDFACKDDCLDRLVPSDLRRLVSQRDQLRAELSALKQSTPIAKVYCVSNKTASMYFSQKENAESAASNFGVTSGLGVTEIALLDAPIAPSEPVADGKLNYELIDSLAKNYGIEPLRLSHAIRVYNARPVSHPAALAEPIDKLLQESKANFERQFGKSETADWVYRDVFELLVLNTQSPQPIPATLQPKGKNEFGLDARYFHEKLSLIVRDVMSFTPEEMQRALQSLSNTAAPLQGDES